MDSTLETTNGAEETPNAEYWIKAGDDYYKNNKNKEAIRCYEEAEKLDPSNTLVYYGLGNALSKLANIEDDVPLFERMFKTYDESSLADIEKDASLLGRAFEMYDKSIQLDHKNAEAFHKWGEALSKLIEIKQDKELLKEVFEKYNAAVLLSEDATILCNCGDTLWRLAITQRDVVLFDMAFDKFERATQLEPNNARAFYKWGDAISSLAKTPNNESLFEKASEKFDKATQLDPNDASAYYSWGLVIFDLARIRDDETLFMNACEKIDKAILLKQNDVRALSRWCNMFLLHAQAQKCLPLLESISGKSYNATQLNIDAILKGSNAESDNATQLNIDDRIANYYWCYAIVCMAKIKRDEDFKEKFDTYEKVSEKIDDRDIYLLKGELYLFFSTKEEEARDCFEKSKYSILEILTFLNKENREKIIKTKILHSLLESNNYDNAFFYETTKTLSEEQKNEYKEVYIRSIYIISLLHVDDENEKLVAYYREKEISQRLLFNDGSKFRLNAIDYSNDPSEGKTLLDFLYGEETHTSDNNINNEEYEAFAGCFVFDYDNLNMFRLYGRNENNEEGTGLSLVFNDSFFSNKVKMFLGSPKTHSSINNIEKDKLALFRCIYIDPNPITKQHIVTVGQKEEYLFYREKSEDAFKEYNDKMKDIIERVREGMVGLREMVRNIDPKIDNAVVGQLLLNLRYLVKHVAFKEEQECRILKIHHLNDKEIIVDEDYKRMYIEYLPEVSSYIDRIYFGPKAEGFELFRSILKNKKLDILCEKSRSPLA